MKKVIFFLMFIVVSLGLTAAELNIYASGLRVSPVNENFHVTISYVLNAPATSLEFQLLASDNEVQQVIAITDAAALTKGSHEGVDIDLHEVPNGTYSWALKASAQATTAVTQVNSGNDYIFYCPQGVCVDNSFDSPYFGRVYVTNAMNGSSDGATAISKAQKRGLFIYDAALQFVYDQQNVGFNGGISWTATRNGIRRVKTDAAGNVYVCDNGDSNISNVYKVDPSNPSANFIPVLDVNKRYSGSGGAKTGKIYTKVNAIEFAKEGTTEYMYVLDWSEQIVRFPVTETLPISAVPDSLANVYKEGQYNSEASLCSDRHGGWWTFQFCNKDAIDEKPMMMHVCANGDVDWKMSSQFNTNIAPTIAKRGAGASNMDGSLVAVGGDNTVQLYSVDYSTSPITVAKAGITIPNIGTNIDAICFDVAGNLYVVSASSERMYAYALPKAENSFTTPAPAISTITLDAPVSMADALTGKTIRRSLMNEGKLYVLAIDNEDVPAIYQINPVSHYVERVLPTTGMQANAYALTAASGVTTMPISDIAFTEDNRLLACTAEETAYAGNMGTHRVYLWDEQTAQWKEWASSASSRAAANFTTAITGVALTYIGTANNGRAITLAETTGPSGEYRFVGYNLTNGEHNTSLYNRSVAAGGTSTINASTIGINPQLIPSPLTGDFLLLGSATSPIEVTLAAHEGVATYHRTTVIPAGTVGSCVFTSEGMSFLAVPSAQGVTIYDITCGIESARVLMTHELENEATYRAVFVEAEGEDLVMYLHADAQLTKIEVSSVLAPVAHILPYGLQRELSQDGLSYTFTFNSNIPATAGTIRFYQDNEEKGSVAITSSIVAGANQVVVAKTDMPQIAGAMTWAVELTGADSKVIGELTDASKGIYNFYSPRGVVVDNSPESAGFGSIYVTQPENGKTDGMTARSREQSAGLFVYNPMLEEMNPANVGYTFGLTLNNSNYKDFKRVDVNAQGIVYVNSTDVVYQLDMSNTNVASTLGSDKFTEINSFCIDGDDMYVMDMISSSSAVLKKLSAGNAISYNTSGKWGNEYTDLVLDGRGGIWISQYREANNSDFYLLSHVNSEGEVDYFINNASHGDLVSGFSPASGRGTMAINREGTLLALSANKTVVLYNVSYDATTGVPSLTRSGWTLPEMGNSVDGIAFDYAGNLFTVNSISERLYAFALPTEANTTLVPARSALTVESQVHVAITEITLSETEASIEKGTTLNLTATIVPEDASDKTLIWSSDNETVATVNTSGVVTALSAGTAHITAHSQADNITSSACTVTVYSLDYNVTWVIGADVPTTSTLCEGNDALWGQFRTDYNAYYVAQGKSERGVQTKENAVTFMYHGVQPMLESVTNWRWLATLIKGTLGTVPADENAWVAAVSAFFNAGGSMATVGQPETWLPLWKKANNYLPATMRATDEMPIIQDGERVFVNWYDNVERTGEPITSVTGDMTLYAKWNNSLILSELSNTNGEQISEYAGYTLDVTIDRRFSLEGGWYTLVLPFDLDDAQLTAAFGEGYQLAELVDAQNKSADAVKLQFAFVTSLEAGTPYLLCPGKDIQEDITFTAVTIQDVQPCRKIGGISMVGLYDRTEIGASETDYYLGNEDYLYMYEQAKFTSGFRAYFHFENASYVRGRLVYVAFGYRTPTDAESVKGVEETVKEIRNGRLSIHHKGRVYTATGQMKERK